MERVLDSAAEIEELEEAMVAKSKVEEVAETQEEEARARAKLKESLLAKSAHLSEKIEYMEKEDLCEYGRLLRESLDVAAKIEELEGEVAEAEEEEDLWEDDEELLRTQYEESLLEQWVKIVDNDAVEEVDEESLLEQWVKMVDNDAVEEVEEDKGKRICAADDSDEKPDSLPSKDLFKPDTRLLKSDSTIIQTLEAYKSDAAATSSAVKSAKLYLDATYAEIDIGVVVGKLIFSVDGYTIDCTKRGSGVGIPGNIDQVGDMKSEALFILLVEKYATYMRLEEEKFYNRFPCIIVRARQPDVATLQFLRKMKVELKIPVLALVDSDPFGVYILSVYGRSMDIKWLGVRPSDLDKHKIRDYVRLPMTEKDIKYVKALLKGDFVKNNPGRVKELNLMMESKYKAECEALSRLGLQYLTKVYLPRKLQEMDWL